jgi:phytoene synthase
VRRLLLSAEPYYQSGFAGLSYLPGQARLGILVAGQVYREIGVELLKSGGDCWERHVVVESSRKAALTAQALVSPFVNPSFWRSPITHDERLHRHLQLFPIAEGLDF